MPPCLQKLRRSSFPCSFPWVRFEQHAHAVGCGSSFALHAELLRTLTVSCLSWIPALQSPNAAAQPSQWVLESAGKPGLVYIRSVVGGGGGWKRGGHGGRHDCSFIACVYAV